jgi:hypothetical protein
VILQNYDESILHYDAKKIKAIKKLLDAQQKEYSRSQEERFMSNIDKSHNDQLKILEKSHALLQTCRTWGGPCTTVQELKMGIQLCKIKKVPLKKMLKSEISMRKVTSPRDVIDRPQLYKLNKLTEDELQRNFTTILQTKFKDVQEMPDEDDILNIIKDAFNID